MGYPATSWMVKPGKEKELAELDKKYMELLIERQKLDPSDPYTNFMLMGRKKKPKPSGAPSKKKAGKQYGGAFTDRDRAKAKAVERSIESGKSLVVVEGDDGKFRIVDADRVKDDDSLTPIFSVTPEGGFVEWDSSLSFDDNMALIQAAIDVEEKDIIEELKPVPVEELDLELKKSKTGSFLPDGLNPIMIENHRKGADADFRKAFHEERLTNWSFWKNQVGEDKFDGVTDAKGALALIDAHYEQVSKTEPVDEALLGILRAERKNFLAMWVPDENMDEVNFYERFNYVNPKRRQAILNKADLGGMLVGKKKAKKGKEKPKKPNVDASINPDQSVVPDPGKPDAPKTPDADLSVPGDTYEPDKVLNLGDKPGKQVMVYKDQLQKNLILNSGTDEPTDVLYMADNDLEDAAKKSPTTVYTAETLFAKGEKDLSDVRQKIADKIKNGEDVTEADVAELIRHENNVKFAKYRLDNANAAKAQQLADAAKAAEDAAKKAEAEQNIGAVKNKVIAATGSQNIQYIADTEAFEQALKDNFGLSTLDDLDADPDAEIALMKQDLNSRKSKYEGIEADVLQKIDEGTVTDEDFQDLEIAYLDYKSREVFVERTEAYVAKKKAEKDAIFAAADGDSDGDGEKEFNPFTDFTTTFSDKVFDTWDEQNNYVFSTKDKFFEQKEKRQKEIEGGSDDDAIISLYGNPDGTIDFDKMNQDLGVLVQAEETADANASGNKADGIYLQGDIDEFRYHSAKRQIFEARMARAEQIAKNKNLAKEAENPQTPDLMPDSDLPDDVADGLPDVDDMAGAIKDKIDNFTPTKATIAQAKTDLMDDDPMPDFKSEEEVDAYFDNLLNKISLQTDAFEAELNMDDTDYAGINQLFGSEEEFDKALRYLKHKKALQKWVKDQKALHKEQLPDPDNPDKPKTVDADVPGESSGGILAQLYASVPQFDAQKQMTKQAAKGKTLDGQINNAEYGKDYLADLPADFFELPADQQMEVLQQLVGKSSPELALGQLYKNYILRSHGDKDSLEVLRSALEQENSTALIDKLKTMEGVENLQDVIDKVSIDLDEALDKLAKANDPLLRLRAQRDVSTARNKYIAALYAKYNDPNSPMSERKIAYNELKKLADYVPEDRRASFKTTILSMKDVQSKPSDKNGGAGMLKTPDFNAAHLGSTTNTGDAVAQTIPVGNAGIFDVSDAATHVSTGGALSQVPDDFLRDSIVANMGEGKRFQPLQIHKGFNKDNFAVVDSVTGAKYIIKTEDRNHMGHIQEAVGAKLANELGFPTAGIRFGSDLKETDLPSARKAAEGVDEGMGRTMVIEHIENQFVGKEYTSIHNVPADQLSGESIARLMVLDRAMNYFDRTPGNMFVVKGDDGKWYLHPIDHGNAFRDWGGSSTEQAAGFVKVTKGDNVDLMGLVSQLPAEEREAWANALNKASRKFAKMDINTLISSQMGQQIGDPEDASRLFKHADFLTAKQGALDWDAMTVDALSKAGFGAEEIDDILTGGPAVKKFALREESTSFSKAKEKLKKLLPGRNKGTNIKFDGGDIDQFDVKVQDIGGIATVGSGDMVDELNAALSVVKPNGEISQQALTMSRFKVRGNAADLVNEEIDNGTGGWKLFGQGHVALTYSTKKPSKGGKRQMILNPNATTDTATRGIYSPGDQDVSTYYKVLDDGSVVFFSKTNNQISSYRNSVTILKPGKSEDVLDSESAFYDGMSAVHVSEMGAPSAEQAREFGVRQLANSLLGATNVNQQEPIEDLFDRLEQKFGITSDEFGVRQMPNGDEYFGLSPEAAKKVADRHGIKSVAHRRTAGGSIATALSSLASGEMASTTERFTIGVRGTGMSSDSDAKIYGSADYLFCTPKTDGFFESGRVYTPPELVMAFPTWYSQPKDKYGNVNERYGLDATFDSNQPGYENGTPEFMLRRGMDLSTSIFVAESETERQEILDGLEKLGLTELNGVPFTDIVVTENKAADAFEALRERLRKGGYIV